MKEKWLNSIALVGFILIVSSWAWWLFRPQPMPFTLRARWKVQDIVTDGIAFSPNGDWLAASVLTSQQGQLTLTVQLWQIPKTQTNPKVFSVSQQVQPMGISSPQLGFSPDGRLLAVGYLEQGVGKVALFTVPEGRRLQTITMGKSKRLSTPTVTFSFDGQLAVFHDLRLWFVRIDDGKKMPTKIQAESIAFSPDGRWIAAIQPNVVNIYDANGHLVKRVHSTSQTTLLTFEAVAFSKDGRRLVCLWSSQHTKSPFPLMRYGVTVWRTDTWQSEKSMPLTPFYEDSLLIRSAAFAPDLSMVALAEPDPSGWDGTLWRLESFVCRLLGRDLPSAPPTQVVVRRLSDGQIVAKLPRFGYYVHGCAFSPDGHYLVVSHGTTIALWERKGD
jgi:WD40 repeat protein